MILLEEAKKFPKKSLSQNFLIDPNIADKILSFARVQPSDCILEIGPGKGALTEKLLDLNALVLAVEKDRDLVKQLASLQKERFFLYEGDILSFPLQETWKKLFEGNGKVISNLPYNISSKVLTLLLQCEHLFSTLTLMVQSEVAWKMMAKVSTKEYGVLSVLSQVFSSPKMGFSVPSSCFYPKPKIASSVVQLTLKETSFEKKHFCDFVKKGFQQRRKVLASLLKKNFSHLKVEKIFQELCILPEARAENLSPDQWKNLFCLLTNGKDS